MKWLHFPFHLLTTSQSIFLSFVSEQTDVWRSFDDRLTFREQFAHEAGYHSNTTLVNKHNLTTATPVAQQQKRLSSSQRQPSQHYFQSTNSFYSSSPASAPNDKFILQSKKLSSKLGQPNGGSKFSSKTFQAAVNVRPRVSLRSQRMACSIFHFSDGLLRPTNLWFQNINSRYQTKELSYKAHRRHRIADMSSQRSRCEIFSHIVIDVSMSSHSFEQNEQARPLRPLRASWRGYISALWLLNNIRRSLPTPQKGTIS